MASQAPNSVKRRALERLVAGKTLKAALLMTNTTADTEIDAVENPADYTTLDEFDGAGYARQTLTGVAASQDDANDRAELDCDDIPYGALSAGTRQVQGVLMIEEVDGTNANDLIICYNEFSSPKTPDGSEFTVLIDADGFLHAT